MSPCKTKRSRIYRRTNIIAQKYTSRALSKLAQNKDSVDLDYTKSTPHTNCQRSHVKKKNIFYFIGRNKVRETSLRLSVIKTRDLNSPSQDF